MSQQEPMITLSDLIDLTKRFKKRILISSISCSLLASLWTLSNPVMFKSEGSFRDKGQTNAGMSQSFSAALLNQVGGNSTGLENEATTTMKSNLLFQRMVEKLHLNGVVSEFKYAVQRGGILTNIADNLHAEFRRLLPRNFIVLADPELPAIEIHNVNYQPEEPYQGIYITFTSEDSFELKDKQQQIALSGTVGKPIHTPLYQFTVVKQQNQPFIGRQFSITLFNSMMLSQELAQSFNVKADKEDKTLIRISCIYKDRILSAKLVNTLMEVYQEYKRDEARQIADLQLDYLSKRHDQIKDVLRFMIKDNAQNISSDLLKLGFPTAQSAIDFLANSQSQQQQRLLMIDLEKKRLEQARGSGYTYFDQVTAHGDASVINHILAEIRELKKQSDNIQFTLNQSTTSDPIDNQAWVNQQMEELNQLTTIADTTRKFITEVESDNLPTELPPILNNPKYLITSWHHKLQDANASLPQLGGQEKQTKLQERDNIKTQFIAYLSQFIRLYDVQANSLKERLKRHQNPQAEFQGIDLNGARELYMTYNKQIQELEAGVLQHEYLIDHIQHPEFEITSLGTILNDPVSHEMITQVSHQVLQLRDTHNRSAREQQRIRDEIELKKGFLAMHLKNASQLIVLKQSLLKKKIKSLQETTLALLQQHISLLDAHLIEYLGQRIKDLDQEKDVLIKYQHDLNTQMVSLPEKWSEERIIDQQLQINTNVSNEVARLIESKNLASNLEVNRSIPVDVAYPPRRPQSAYLILFAAFGAFLGFFMNLTYLFGRTVLSGVPVSRNNLILSGYHVAGSLTSKLEEPLRDTDLETLRAIATFLPDTLKHTLLVSEQGTSFSIPVVQLLAKRGYKVLVLPLTFDTADTSPDGLLPYLQGQISEPRIHRGNGYDFITPGGITRFSNELLASHRFMELYNRLKTQYDWIVGVSKTSPRSAEIKDLLSLFDHAVLAVQDETLQELPSSEKAAKAIFVV